MDDKIVIIGLDGVPFEMIEGFAKEGIMPNTARLIEEGVFRKSRSSIPEISNVAWSSVITGKNPGEHGIYGFTDLRPQSYKLKFPNFNDLKAEPFWRQWNQKSVIMNVPSTYPVQPMNGIHISGFVSIDINKSIYPTDIVEQLEDINYRLDVDSRKAHKSMSNFLEDVDQTLDARIAAYRYLWDDSIDWGSFMLVFTGTDRLMHFLWNAYESPRHRFNTAFSLHFGRIDKIIGEITSKLKRNNLLVMLSDHGFERLYRDVYVNNLLIEDGFLSLDGEGSGFEAITLETKAFALDPARIYINYQDRFPKGSISRYETDGLLKELEQYFENLRYGGRKVIKDIYRKEEIYSGECLPEAPDLVLVAENEFNLKASLNSKKSFDKGIFTGKHTPDTAFMLFHGLKDNSIVPDSPQVSDMRWIIEKDRKIRY